MLSDSFDKKSKQALCTQTGSAISTLLFYPIDTVRFRTMSQDTTDQRLHNNRQRYRGITQPLKIVVQHEGYPALFRGASVAVGGAAASWGIYIYMYRSLQQISQEKFAWPASFEADLFNSTAASVGTAYLTTPVWHVKTRMQLEDTTNMRSSNSSGAAGAVEKRKYSRFIPSLVAVCKTDGFLGMWRGFAPQLLMSVVNGAYLPIYQRALVMFSTPPLPSASSSSSSSSSSPSSSSSSSVAAGSWTSRIANTTTTTSAEPEKKQGNSTTASSSTSRSVLAPSSWTVALASASTRTVISILSNPFFVIRTKLQDERHSVDYRNLWQSLGVIMRREGVRGLFRGMQASLAITAPKAVATMVLTEKLYQIV